ncbi:monosaccharide ABC transporter ATP-binding protein (CUT2 family) [Stackebrandtia endophytica]|uniref:Monosaccharide ABC transporter ATP-binding protein (CUT2 family) n=1 Tax=Stackebrandtia endophytica TaxID=1496996 RepID=A0A543ATI7_9ACTN|nr:sugar ABC transporter ATP-binding protein [Stackebrandtia endophytica]TQL75899.1 monosaccharide ABC transporter ATP-binding protein (CUT2 family) [Stackebrandtia endophytica]
MEASPPTPLDGEVTTGDAPLVSVRDMAKAYGDNIVLRGINLDFAPGEVIAFAGENGAGKSTLMKILAGLVVPDTGTVHISGEPLAEGSVHASRRHGIAIVPQELAPVPDLPIYANIFLGRERRTRFGALDKRAMIDESARLLRSFNLDVDPRATMRNLSTATRQLIEIIKCTSTGARVILLDEPTSAIPQHEVEQLYRIIENLRSQGVAMLYTTHKMAEIRAVATRVVVLRDGVLIADEVVDDIDDERIVTAMIGRELGELYPTSAAPGDSEVVLELRDLVVEPGGAPVSLTVRSGEIVALAGLLGAGRTELLETAFGARRTYGGSTLVNGRTIRPHNPAAAIRDGMALVPEDRKVSGALLSMSILQNAILPRLAAFSVAGWVADGRASKKVDRAMDAVRLKRTGLRQEVGSLSGGNQQKVVIGRWLTGDVQVLLLDEPTRGVDVGARSEIYQLIVDLARERGIAVLMASSDMTEVIGLAHRVVVMRDRQIAVELDRADHPEPEAFQELVFRHAAGISPVPQEISHVR